MREAQGIRLRQRAVAGTCARLSRAPVRVDHRAPLVARRTHSSAARNATSLRDSRATPIAVPSGFRPASVPEDTPKPGNVAAVSRHKANVDARSTFTSVDEPIRVVSYRDEWPHAFEKEAARLARVLRDEAIDVEHIGSTAVPGLAAKPVVDVMVGVRDLAATAELAERLTMQGYEDCGGEHNRRYFRKRDGQHFNVQVIEYDSPKWQANLLLREYLRANQDAARRYADAKRVAAITSPTLLAYSMRKSAIVEELLSEAETGSSSSELAWASVRIAPDADGRATTLRTWMSESGPPTEAAFGVDRLTGDPARVVAAKPSNKPRCVVRLAQRPNGMVCAGLWPARPQPVSVGPGFTVLTVIRRWASSSASVSVACCSAPFETA